MARWGRRRARSGFTLVELMIVVAIIGVLAALAIYGVRRYLTHAKATEAVGAVGHMSSAAHAAFEREYSKTESVAEGALSMQASHALCETSIPVPATVPAGKKYQPITLDGSDFGTGTDSVGWQCLRFRIDSPIYFQYRYTKGSSPVAPGSPSACTGACYEAGAMGDLNGNGIYGLFARTGHLNVATGALRASTTLYIEREDE